MRNIRRAAGIIYATMVWCALHAQGSYVVEYIGFADGLPSINIDAVAQDSQGLIWFASFGTGLIRYDGSTFKTLNRSLESEPALSSNHVRDVIVDYKGRLWVAHHSGIDIIEPKTLKIIDRLPLYGYDNSVKGLATCLYLDKVGNIWVAAYNKGVFRFLNSDPNQGSVVDTLPQALYINQTPDGKIQCLSTLNGIYTLEKDHFKFAFPSFISPEGGNAEIKPIENPEGQLTGFRWIYSEGIHKLYHYDLQKRQFLPGTPEDGITAFLSPLMHQKLLENESPITKAPLFYHPFRTFKDNLGVIWVAPQYGGVFKLKRREIMFETCPDLKGVSLRGMIELPDGSLYIASYNGVFHYNPKANRAKRLGNNPKDIFFNLSAIQGDTLTALSETYGLNQYFLNAKNKIVKIPMSGGSRNQPLFASLPLDDDWILVGNNKIFRYRPADSRLEAFGELPTHPEVATFCYKRTRDGRIWVGTTEGVFILTKDGKGEIALPRLDYRLANQSRINDIFEDKRGRLWFATASYGLLCYDPVTQLVQAFDQKSGFSSNETYKILSSHSEEILWISTFKGLQCIQLSSQKIHYFNELDGTSGNEFNTGSCLQAKDGTFYFGGVKGLTRFVPDSFNPASVPPASPYITALSIEDIYSNVIKTLNLPPRDTLLQLNSSQNTLEFQFGNNDYFRPATNTCYVKLEQVDENWVSLGSVTSVKYYRLPPGQYKLSVRFNNQINQKNSQIYAIRFEIDQVFYKKWWFIALVIFAVSGMVFSVFRMRSQRFKREQKLRREIAHNLHNSLGGRISFISNMLYVINRLNEKGEPFQHELQQLIDQTMKVHSTMSDVIWALSRTKKVNAGLIHRMEDYADKWLKLAHIQVDFEQNISKLERSIPFTIQHELILVYKEILGNILKHTFSERVYIAFWLNPDKSIDLTVLNLFSERKKDAPSSNQGLSIMKEHIERIGGVLSIHAEEHSFEVTIHFEKPFKNWRDK